MNVKGEIVDMTRYGKKIKRRTPSGKSVIRRGRPNPSKPKCAECGSPLHGMPRMRPVDVKRTPKSKRKPNRPFGGNLCPKCTRAHYKSKVN
jgi:large subunit ribosomal protein L34e